MILMYEPNSKRYLTMTYNRCGKSGLKLPAVSLGLWHNFGDTADYENMKALVFTAFDNGITHFDLANNYGPAPGSAERNFGKILKEELSPYRDELIISGLRYVGGTLRKLGQPQIPACKSRPKH
jgi:L-glyceraldehyde 3-phosphate reductase